MLGARLSDWDIGTVARYERYLSLTLRLHEIPVNSVWSFRIGRGGLKALLKSKTALKIKIDHNRAALKGFVLENSAELSIDEKNLIGCLVKNNEHAIEILSDHIATCERLIDSENKMFFYDDLADEIPF